MKKKNLNIFEFIVKFNQIGLFIALSIFVFVMVKDLIPHPQRWEPRVDVVDNIEDIPERERLYTVQYLKEIKNTQIFALRRSFVEKRTKLNSIVSDASTFGYGGNGEMVNVIFHREGNEFKLFEQDLLILDCRIAEFDSVANDRKQYYSFEENLFFVVADDTDNDGALTIEDEKQLFVSEYDGTNLRRLVENVQEFSIKGNDRLVVQKDNEDFVEFYFYTPSTEKLEKITIRK